MGVTLVGVGLVGGLPFALLFNFVLVQVIVCLISVLILICHRRGNSVELALD